MQEDYYDLVQEGWDPIMDAVEADNRLDPLSADYDPEWAQENEDYEED